MVVVNREAGVGGEVVGGSLTSRPLGRILMELARTTAWGQSSLEDSLGRITERAAEALDVERVSVWEYRENRTKLVCLDLFERGPGRHSNGYELTTGEYPAYFRALEVERVIDAQFALTDPRTREFAESYLKPLGINSMLDSPFLAQGEIGGVVCLEHVGAPRRFLPRHLEFAASVADIIALGREVHERVRAQQALRQSERNLRRIFDSLPQIIYVKDVDGKLSLVNKALARAYGRSAEEILAAEDSDDRIGVGQPLEAADLNGTREETFVDAHGQLRILQTATFPIELAGKSSILGVSTDITEFKRSELIQIGWNRVLASLASGADVRSVLSLLASVAEEINPDSLVTILLLDKKEGALRHAAAPSFPDFYVQAVDGLKIGPSVGSCGTAAFTGRETIVADVMEHPYWEGFRDLATRAGIRACWSRPILAKNHEVLGTFAVYYRTPREPTAEEREFIRHCSHVAGITIEHWRTERDVQRAYLQLEKRVEERTRDLSRVNSELQQEVRVRQQAESLLKKTAEVLKRSNADLEEFAYVASHDLQEPLRKIQAFSDLLEQACDESIPETGRDYLVRIRSAATRMRALITDLLAFSRVGDRSTPSEMIDLGTVVQDVLSDLGALIEEQDAEVTVGEMPTIFAHATEMHQLFQNLIGNSLKYQTSGRKARVRVKATHLRDSSLSDSECGDGRKRVEIRVIDNGIGFDVKYLDRIFSPFQRLHGRREFEGTGMGLAVCRKIVERHGGRITAQSEPGRGSIFIIRLPVKPTKEIT